MTRHILQVSIAAALLKKSEKKREGILIDPEITTELMADANAVITELQRLDMLKKVKP